MVGCMGRHQSNQFAGLGFWAHNLFLLIPTTLFSQQLIGGVVWGISVVGDTTCAYFLTPEFPEKEDF